MRMRLGGTLQLAGSGVVGRALMAGPIHHAWGAEVAVPAVGSGFVLPGRELEKAS